MVIFLVPDVSPGQTTTTILNAAIQATVAGDLATAEQQYRQLIAQDPMEGFPRLARFYLRTNQTSAALQLLNEPEVAGLSPLTRGRVTVAAGLPQRAVELLRQPPAPGEAYQQAVLLSTQLEKLGQKQQAATVIEEALSNPEVAVGERRDLLKALLRSGDPGRVRHAFVQVMEQLVTSSTLAYPDLRQTAIDGLTVIAASPAYPAFHAALDSSTTRSATASWMLALSNIRRGRPEAARDILHDEVKKQKLTDREKTVVFEELARLLHDEEEQALSLYEQLLAVAPDPQRLRLVAAQIRFKRHEHAQALALVEKVDPEKLDQAHKRIYANLLLSASAAVSPDEVIVQNFEKASRQLKWEQVRELAEAPFTTINDPERIKTLTKAVKERLKHPDARAELYVLLMSLSNREQDNEGVIAALEGYLQKRPQDPDALQEYADMAANQAFNVATADPRTSAPVDKLESVADRASRALWKLVESKPYVPDSYIKLMELYRLYGQTDKSRKVPTYLITNTSGTAEQVHLAAYLLATNGYPQDAIPLYERALKQEPNNGRYRLNYAQALTRVGRPEEAMKIYKDLIRNGVYGKQYHTHEVFQSAWETAQQQGKVEELAQYLKSLLSDKTVAERPTFLFTAGKLFAFHNRPAEALPFYEELRANYPEQKTEAEDAMVEAYVKLQDFATAEKLLADVEKQSTGTEDLITARYNMAQLKQMQGNLERAVDLWTNLAKQFPQDRQATRSMLSAAQALIEAGRLEQARTTLQQYLALNTGDADGEQSAHETLARLQSNELEPALLLKSALEEAATSPTRN